MLAHLVVMAYLQVGHSARDCSGVPATSAPRAVANDNRRSAGTLRDGILTVRLAARETSWHPDGPDGCGLRVLAFAEEGQSPRIPGPLIRVRAGTEVRVILRNTLSERLRIRGLVDRREEWPALELARIQLMMDSNSVEIGAGETREFRFQASLPGNYYYWGRLTATDTMWQRFPGRYRADLSLDHDGQLVGALIVDPEAGSPPDRVFVLTHIRQPGTRSFNDPVNAREVNAINGLSWPHTERLTATVGDAVRWRILNPGGGVHTMHLHGFYYRVVQRGYVSAIDSVLAPEALEDVVSEFMPPNRTLTMEWVPERPGNWLFHCHFLVHMSPAQQVERAFGNAPPRAVESRTHHGEHDMAGPIVGITVRSPSRPAAPAATAPRRVLRLFANERNRVFGNRPGLGFVLQSGDQEPAVDSILIPGSPLVLTKGEPTRITVINRLRVGLGVHWHGLELESYFDGVPGFSGAPGRLMPPVQAGDSFNVFLTPPRAGTFMYHVHSEQSDELSSGLYGPFIVLEPGHSWDTGKDHLFVLSNGGPGDSPSTIFINGTTSPLPMELRAGVPHRLRFMSIPANGEFVVRLLDGSTPVTWRQIARDGADLAPSRTLFQPARSRIDVGITKDFEFTPEKPGDLVLEADHRVPSHATRLLIRVR